MIHLFHGDDIYSSRKELTKFRKMHSNYELIILDGKLVALSDLIQVTESRSLFNDLRQVIVENIFSRQFSRKSKELMNFIAWIKRIPETLELVFWEEKELPKSIINEFPKSSDIALFQPDRQIFALLDVIKPDNSAKKLLLFQACLKTDAVELIFAMFIRQLRLLIMAKDLQKNLPGVTPWQASKLQSQSQLFSQSILISLYQRLLDIDLRLKSGYSPFDLTAELKMFLIGF